MKGKVIKTWKFLGNEIQVGTELTILKGMEADGGDVLNIPCGMCYLCKLEEKIFYIPALNVNITDYIDWEHRRYEISKCALQGYLASPIIPGVDPNPSVQKLAEYSVRVADALIEELKKR